ncbi:phospholipid-binding protein, PBP family [Candidatus Kryptobacter tengchongensis]|nr:phospholipid-binding protein, PBP family [Candidatus Kryptobacter tengchongensis]
MKYLLLILLSFLFATQTNFQKGGVKKMFSIKSTAFKYGETIPKKFTCDGQDYSPELSWENAPAGTKSFALICEDPDAPGRTFIHWVIYDIPANVTRLAENVKKVGLVDDKIKQGINDFGRIGYGGPCPPRGHKPHRYIFKLYALDVETLGLNSGATAEQVEAKAKGHILGEAKITGLYGR